MQPFLRIAWMSVSSGSNAGGAERSTADPLAREVARLNASSHAGRTAAYRLVTPGEKQQAIIRKMERMGRAMDVGDAYRRLPDHVLLTELPSVNAALGLEEDLARRVGDGDDGETTDVPQIVVHGLYRELSLTHGNVDSPSPDFAAAIQLGTFNMRSSEDEWAVMEWYRSRRLPGFAQLPGALRARQLVSVCGGPARLGILYEFASLTARLEHFEPMNVEDHDVDAHTSAGPDPSMLAVADRTVHPPMSPSVGEAVG